ncbi:MAG: hypothetical protein H6686_08350 [Fibrobacteria bacterium]|nr:hypothetical protein [Fibrobacteria bacterium]
MDPGVLILLACTALHASRTDTLAPGVDSLETSWRPAPTSWKVPERSGSVSGALANATHRGWPGVPWVLSAELDGQFERWLPWVGLPLSERPVFAQGESDLLAGAGGAGPLHAYAVEPTSRPGLGGEPERLLDPWPAATDTPSTGVQFWRGAVNSYRFGFGLSRAVLGPWSLDLRMNTRSAPGRFWEYRQQVNDMFGPRGKPQGLPYQGHGPGQDDVRWETSVSRTLPGGRLDLGWNWVDLERGIPDPLSTWDSLRPKIDGAESRSGFFGRLDLRRSLWSLHGAAREGDFRWELPAWSDTGVRVLSSGSESVREGDFHLGLGTPGAELRLEARRRESQGSAQVMRSNGDFDDAMDENLSRVGVSGNLRWGDLLLKSGGGWTLLEAWDGQDHDAFDARSELSWTPGVFEAALGWNRSNLLPGFDRELRPDPALPFLDQSNLGTETRDLATLRLGVRGGAGSVQIGGALLQIEGASRASILPGEGPEYVADRSLVLRRRDRGTVQGYSLDAGISSRWKTFEGSTRLGWGWTGLPGGGFSGKHDPSEATLRTRSKVQWSDELLPGRFRATSSLELSTWNSTSFYVPVGREGAIMTNLPASWNLDLENRVTIRTFDLFWRIENLGDRKQAVLPGWTPLGIRSGWGVVWTFGG